MIFDIESGLLREHRILELNAVPASIHDRQKLFFNCRSRSEITDVQASIYDRKRTTRRFDTLQFGVAGTDELIN